MAKPLDFSAAGIVEALATNPINWVLAVVFLGVVHTLLSRPSVKVPPPRHPDVRVLRTFTPKELAHFTGRDGTPIYIAVNRRVYDVSRSAGFYGPEGPYNNFAGHDASRGLAKTSFDSSMLADINGPIDPLDNLSGEERHTLAEWAELFESKYDYLGTLIENTD